MPSSPSASAATVSASSAIFDRAAVSSLIAGASAGIISDGVTHPISTAKSRLQVLKIEGPKAPSTFNVLASIVREEGWRRMYAGFGTVTVAAPARAMYFLGYELSKRQGDRILGAGHPATAFLSGPIAQLSGSLLWVPMDVVKERLQIQRNPILSGATSSTLSAPQSSAHGATQFRGSMHAATTILRDEGIRGLYRGYWAHQCVWGPFNAVYFTGYEFLKREWTSALNPAARAKVQNEPVVSSFGSDGAPISQLQDNVEVVPLPSYAYPICGAISGCLAAAATAPLDLIKTRLQTQGKSGKYSGAVDCAIKMVRGEGAASLMRGLGARCLWLSPNIALTMTTYELIKEYFRVP